MAKIIYFRCCFVFSFSDYFFREQKKTQKEEDNVAYNRRVLRHVSACFLENWKKKNEKFYEEIRCGYKFRKKVKSFLK